MFCPLCLQAHQEKEKENEEKKIKDKTKQMKDMITRNCAVHKNFENPCPTHISVECNKLLYLKI